MGDDDETAREEKIGKLPEDQFEIWINKDIKGGLHQIISHNGFPDDAELMHLEQARLGNELIEIGNKKYLKIHDIMNHYTGPKTQYNGELLDHKIYQFKE